MTRWHENGQKRLEATFVDGKQHGPWAMWYENGEKEMEGTFKDGGKDGVQMDWYENGQARSHLIFKDGKLISAKSWNSKGEVEADLESLK